MIESSLAFQANSAKSDASYKHWQGTMVATRARQSAMRYDTNDRTSGPMPTFGGLMNKASVAGPDLANAYAPSSSNSMAAKPDIVYDSAKKEDGFSFGDVIDVINPLQHLPILGTLYRKFTGDTMKGFSEILGGTLYGGPIGAVASTVNVIMKDRTGKDMADNVLSLAGLESTPTQSSTTLTYLDPKSSGDLAGTTLAVANLSLARDGRHNFAARASTSPPTQYWNV